MSPKRKIPSRKFASRKLPSRKIPSRKLSSPTLASSKLPSRKLASGKLASRSVSGQKSTSKQPTQSAAASPHTAPTIPVCFWDLGFETVPTIDELQRRYRELSLVLHPDARGTKESFQQLRATYETALALLERAT